MVMCYINEWAWTLGKTSSVNIHTDELCYRKTVEQTAVFFASSLLEDNWKLDQYN